MDWFYSLQWLWKWILRKSERIIFFSQKTILNNVNFKTAIQWCLNVGTITYPLQFTGECKQLKPSPVRNKAYGKLYLGSNPEDTHLKFHNIYSRLKICNKTILVPFIPIVLLIKYISQNTVTDNSTMHWNLATSFNFL